MGKAKMGYVISVVNSNPRPNASACYKALWIEDEDGDNERCIMFRQSDIDGLPLFSFPKSFGIEKKMKEGRLYAVEHGSVNFFVMKIVVDGAEKVVKITEKKLLSAEKLAQSNPEDIPDRGFLNDMLD